MIEIIPKPWDGTTTHPYALSLGSARFEAIRHRFLLPPGEVIIMGDSLSHYDLYVKCGKHVYLYQCNRGDDPTVSLITSTDPEAPDLTHQQVIENLVEGRMMSLKRL